MKALVSAVAVAALAASLPFCNAESLKGSTVTGTLYLGGDMTTNYFATASADGTDTATVGPGTEFTEPILNFFTPSCTYSVNLSAKQIAISDVCTKPVISFAATPAATKVQHENFELQLSDEAFIGDTITSINNGLGLDLLPISGDTLTFLFNGGLPASNKSTYNVASATSVTPEPASWQLLALGAAGLLGFATLSRRERVCGAGLAS